MKYIGSKFLNLGEALSREITFFIVCMSESDIDRHKCGRDNLFRNFNIVKSIDENFVISNSDRNKII
ncbi:hypothetical protein RIR_jg31873.t1 [Rhizophagus irregularis DAOM 181602=DAOM 197198]|nr:hypothetical protein RIR_jg31873.t1 [Rhizophagus irregularis DAOM 181602=DAOM 197198]